MFKWLKTLLDDWNQVTDEIAAMGIITSPWGSYFNKEIFDEYCKKIEKDNQSSSKSSQS